MMPDCIIEIHGINLDDLRFKLRRRQVSFIQEYSAMVHKVPIEDLPENEAVIENIYVHHYGDQITGWFERKDKSN